MKGYLPEIDSYGNYTSDNYGIHSLRVAVGALTLWFSYSTVVAFRDGNTDEEAVRQNDWGPTTGKHLNWIDGGGGRAKAARLPGAEFEARLRAVLVRYGLAEADQPVRDAILLADVKARGVQTVINDNDAFDAWLRRNVTLEDALRRVPDLMTELFEEYNNDYIEAVESFIALPE